MIAGGLPFLHSCFPQNQFKLKREEVIILNPKEEESKTPKKRAYQKPILVKVELIPDEAVVLGCWNCGNSSGGSC